MRKRHGAVFILAAFAIAGCDSGGGADEQVAEMVEWSERNPPVSEDTWAGVRALTCRPQKMEVCGNEGCKPQDAKVWLEFAPKAGIVSRCDSGGCDDYTAEVSYSGSWATITIPGRASFAKITASGEYIEVASLMQEVLIYRGKCKARR